MEYADLLTNCIITKEKKLEQTFVFLGPFGNFLKVKKLFDFEMSRSIDVMKNTMVRLFLDDFFSLNSSK